MVGGRSLDLSLVEASEENLHGLLIRGNKRRTVLQEGVIRAASGACGTLAKRDRDEPAENLSNNAEKDDNDASDLDWEEVNEEAEFHSGEAESPEPLLVSIESATTVAKRQGVTKKERQAAQRLHRSHLLCLLGRALLFDKAATDGGLQAVMLSLMPASILDCASQGTMEGVQSVLSWFHQAFQPQRTAVGGAHHDTLGRQSPQQVGRATSENKISDQDDVLEVTLQAARLGLSAIVAQLFEAAQQQKGSVEQLSTLFVAALRATGFCTRSVCALHAVPLNPREAWRPDGDEGRTALSKSSRRTRGKNTADSAGQNTKPTRHKKQRKTRSSSTVTAADPFEEEGPSSLSRSTASGLDRTTPSDTPQEERKRNRGDEELERQLAMAMAATAFQAERDRDGEEQESNNKRGATSSNLMPKNEFQQANTNSMRPSSLVSRSELSGLGRRWAEVLLVHENPPRWVAVDGITGWLDRASEMETLQPPHAPLRYVVGLAGGGAKDLTRRYAADWVAAERGRDGAWWDATLSMLRRQESAYVHNATLARDKAPTKSEDQSTDNSLSVPLDVREEDELARRALSHEHSVPSTQAGFRNHSVYVLVRYIPRHQALRPGSKPCGTHRGEHYYKRLDLGDVHTVDRWRRLGHEVLPEELDKPVKTLKKRSLTATSSGRRKVGSMNTIGAHEEEEEEQVVSGPLTLYYGAWQTRAAEPLRCVNCHVPRNSQGNVEVPPLMHALPVGAVHIDLPGIAPVCHALGVDAAPALAGFEHRGGRAVPLIRGVVVAEENEASVLQRYWEVTREREERAKAKRRDEAEAAWKLLLRSLLARVRIQQRYGSETAMQDASATLVESQRPKNLRSSRSARTRGGAEAHSKQSKRSGLNETAQNETLLDEQSTQNRLPALAEQDMEEI